MHRLNKVSLSGLRAVEAIGRLGTLKAAAAELGVTPGALSQRLQKTEDMLRIPLFRRVSTGLVPTDACAKILPRLTSAMGELSTAVSMLDPEQDRLLTISVAPIFASRWLVWRIRRFNEAHPDIAIRIDPSVALVDPDAAGVDICLRVGSGSWPGMHAQKLLDQMVFPVCSPEVAGRVRHVCDLVNVPVIRENEKHFGWDIWLKPHGLSVSDLSSGPTYADASLCLDAAMTGQGIFMAWETLASDALDAGRLVAPFPERRATGMAYWFITGEGGQRKASVARFREWVQGELGCSVRHWRERARQGSPS